MLAASAYSAYLHGMQKGDPRLSNPHFGATIRQHWLPRVAVRCEIALPTRDSLPAVAHDCCVLRSGWCQEWCQTGAAASFRHCHSDTEHLVRARVGHTFEVHMVAEIVGVFVAGVHRLPSILWFGKASATHPLLVRPCSSGLVLPMCKSASVQHQGPRRLSKIRTVP